MKNSILLENIKSELLLQKFDEINNRFDDLKKSIGKQPTDELMTRKETCEYLKIDSSTLWAWTNKGKVSCFGIANRRYYKKSELLECLTLLKK